MVHEIHGERGKSREEYLVNHARNHTQVKVGADLVIYGTRWWWWCRVTTSNNKHDLLRESVCVCEGINIDFVNLVTTCEARLHARHTRIHQGDVPCCTRCLRVPCG